MMWLPVRISKIKRELSSRQRFMATTCNWSHEQATKIYKNNDVSALWWKINYVKTLFLKYLKHIFFKFLLLVDQSYLLATIQWQENYSSSNQILWPIDTEIQVILKGFTYFLNLPINRILIPHIKSLINAVW